MKPSGCGPERISVPCPLRSVSDQNFYLMVIPPVWGMFEGCCHSRHALMLCKWLVMCCLCEVLKVTATEKENGSVVWRYVLIIHTGISIQWRPPSPYRPVLKKAFEVFLSFRRVSFYQLKPEMFLEFIRGKRYASIARVSVLTIIRKDLWKDWFFSYRTLII